MEKEFVHLYVENETIDKFIALFSEVIKEEGYNTITLDIKNKKVVLSKH